MHAYLSFLLVYYSIYLANAVGILTLKKLVFKNNGVFADFLLLASSILVVGIFSLLYAYHPGVVVANFIFNISILWLAKKLFKNYSYAGINFYLANYLTIGVGLLWGLWFLSTLPVSIITKLLLITTAPFIAVTLPSGILQLFEQYDVACREVWNRPKHSFPERPYNHEPMVSLHVPTYSEPPEIVIETLNKLSKLDYNNYEVLVIDNNTTDSSLWLPVEAHCKKLGKKFRFFHVDNLPGAKGGALNYALKQTNIWASIVGVVDSDYHANSDFLKALVGHFDDMKIGFVQTPHDYRGWQNNPYLTMCYWEYKIFFHSAMVSLNEIDAGITVGTMCLIRKSSLQEAGGWSETCVTEDSELAIRIHNQGYSSVYVDKTYGWGLIPETFESYKKQRYRWTAGPVQEFQNHFKLFVGFNKQKSSFNVIQRIFHLNHGLHNVLLGLNIPFIFVSALTVISMVLHREIVAVPFELWLAATVLLVSSPLLTWLMFKITINPGFWEIVGESFASSSLSYVISTSALRTLLTGKAVWNRTNKFRSKYSYLGALFSTKEEIIIGATIIGFIAWAYLSLPYTGLALMFLIGFSYISLNYFAAPLFALVNVWSMKRRSQEETINVQTNQILVAPQPAFTSRQTYNSQVK